jgi:polysaccharide export outer membrane protein
MIERSKRFLAALLMLAVSACATPGSDLPALPDDGPVAQTYILGPGDRVAIHLYGIDDAAGAVGQNQPNGPAQNGYTISEAGLVGVPLVGEMPAAGMTAEQLKDKIAAKLAKGYIKNPKVGIEILAYRSFYIFGEVNHPGPFAYAANLNVLSAVATAGGYTHRADEDFVVIERKVGNNTVKAKAGPQTTIRPDDIVRVPERFF